MQVIFFIETDQVISHISLQVTCAVLKYGYNMQTEWSYFE